MKLDEAPLHTLARLAEQGASGELICASPSAEVHVYLQRGRVAWATDSEHPFAFTRHLQTTAKIDDEGFRDILESCKRERRPLGETLVAWGLVTSDEIRAALRHQLDLALAQLRDGGPAQTLFLDRTRQFARYAEVLTFALGELLSEGVAAAPSLRTTRGGAFEDAEAPTSARRLLESGPDIVWTERFAGEARVESEPEPASGPRFAPEVLEKTLLDGAELAILWLPDGLLAGVALPTSQSLWCRFAPDATVGAAASALGAIASSSGGPCASCPDCRHGAPWDLAATGEPAGDEMRALLDRAPEMLAAFVLDTADERRSCGVGRAPLAPEAALDTVRRRARVLTIESVFEDGLARTERESFSFRSMVTAEPRVWCFGAELASPARRTVWVLLDRRCSQGLGWAYLTSLSRNLMRVRTEGCHG